MSKIWLTSDLHLGHDREFIWGARGFDSMAAHNAEIIRNINKMVAEDDELYILGDLMLGDNNIGIRLLEKIKCNHFHIIRGNHDTDTRWNLYSNLTNVIELTDVVRLKYNGYHFYLSHYPTLTGNLEKESLKAMEINLYAHSHQKTNFYMDMPFMYHVGLDSHNNKPVLLDDIIEECKAKVKECKDFLGEGTGVDKSHCYECTYEALCRTNDFIKLKNGTCIYEEEKN